MLLAIQGPELEPVLKNIPDIIKEASQSQLGILALLIIVLFGLAIYFFRTAPMKLRAVIFLVFFAGVVAYGWEINRAASKPGSMHYTGRVLDKVTAAPIHEATVAVSLGSNHFPPYRSDSDGNFSFWLERKKASDDASVRIEHASYSEYDRTVSSDGEAQLGDIRLVPLSASVPASGPQPSTSSSTGASPPSPTARATASRSPASEAVGALAGRTRSGRIPPIASHPANARLEMAETHTPRTVESSSGPKLSGKGKDWSPWYEVRVGVAPQGYTIDKVEFWLTGDRACGAWAQCKEVAKSDNEVFWSFCLQGHDEWGAPPQAYSEGHLRVVYTAK